MGAIKQTPAAPDVTTGAPASPEQAADLAALHAHASADPTAPAPAPEPEAVNYAIEAAGMVDLCAALICGYEPKCLPHWGDDRKAGITAALSPVLEKYDFTLGSIPPELTLLVMAAPPLYLSMRIIADGMNKQAAQKSADSGDMNAGGVTVPGKPAAHDPASLDVPTHSKEMMTVL